MSGSQEDDLPFGLGGGQEPRTAVHSFRADKPKKTKRFYKSVETALSESGLHRVLLDGRAIRTPAKSHLEVPVAALAQAIAEEWQAQENEIDPTAMPLTRLANTAIDRVGPSREAILAELASYAEGDLICYRADAPQVLVERQAQHWDPLADWFAREFGVALKATDALVHVEQDPAVRAHVEQFAADLDTFHLTGLADALTLTGSPVISLALYLDRLSAEEAFQAAHLEEHAQLEIWGSDSEAEERLAKRREGLAATARFFGLLRSAT